MDKDEKKEIKIKLIRVHYLNGIRKPRGSVIRVPSMAGKWLLDKKIGLEIQ